MAKTNPGAVSLAYVTVCKTPEKYRQILILVTKTGLRAYSARQVILNFSTNHKPFTPITQHIKDGELQ